MDSFARLQMDGENKMRQKETPTAVFEVAGRNSAISLPPPATISKALEALGETWIPSRFNVTTALRGSRKAIHNTFTGATAVLNHRSWQRYLRSGFEYRLSGQPVPEQLQALYSRGFLVSKDVDEVELARFHYLASRFDRDTLNVTMLCTLACNLCCAYCFEGQAQADHRGTTMSKETEEAVVAHLSRAVRGKKGLSIWWFGGEPLLTMGPMERISSRLIRICKKGGIHYTAMIATNGTLLTRDVIKQLRRWKVASAQVTLDIPRAAKRDKHGRETQEKVLDNLCLAAGKLKVHLRINLSKDNEAEFDRLYRGLIRRKLHKTLDMVMGIAHVFAPERGRLGCTVCPVGHQSYVHVLAREHAKAAALGLPLRESLVSSPGGGCSATRESAVVIGPDGLLYKCVEDVGLANRAYGSVFLEDFVKPGNLLPWLTYDWFQHAMCKGCPVLPQCAGGCPHRRLFQSGSLKDEDFCYWDMRGDLEDRIRKHALEKEASGV
ncbi:MAG: SPASM domain-containing protein [Verrucomicrobia bacterium]|nr:SPASM domain-containing protein [Verrucomicrobiota bacterium]